MKRLLSLCLILLATNSFANTEHNEKEFITGSGFDMTKINDIIVGSYNMIPVWAEKVCGSHIKGTFRKDTTPGEFSVLIENKKLIGRFAGVTIGIAGIDKEKQIITLSVVGPEGTSTSEVHFAYESFAENHFQNITFEFDGNTVKLEGEACLGSTMFFSIFLKGMTLL
jgi:hypothetical protein